MHPLLLRRPTGKSSVVCFTDPGPGTAWKPGSEGTLRPGLLKPVPPARLYRLKIFIKIFFPFNFNCVYVYVHMSDGP